LPVAEASVQAERRPPCFGDVLKARRTAVSRFDVRDGEYFAHGAQAGFRDGGAAVVVKGAPVEGLELRLQRGATLVGELRGLRFSELPRARISAQRPSVRRLHGRADFAGASVCGLRPATGRCRRQWRLAARRAPAVSIAPGDDEVPVVLEFAQGLTLSGVVRRSG
jgi:hypothetical protein